MWVSVRDAATLLNVSEDTVRRRIRSGDIPSSQEPTRSGFRWLVEVPNLVVEPAPADAPHAHRTDSESAAADPAVEALREAVAALERAREQDQANFERERATIAEQLTERTREVRELHILLARAQGHSLPLQDSELTPAHASAAARAASQHRRPRPLWIRLLDALRAP